MKTSPSSRSLDPFRLAAIVLVLYTAGHTLGAVIETPHFGLASDGVVTLMKSVRFTAQSADCTWYGFYRGFGIIVSIFFVLSAVMAWTLGGTGPRERRALAPLAWSLFVAHAATMAVAWIDFFPASEIFATVVTLLLGYGCIRAHRDAATLDARSVAAG